MDASLGDMLDDVAERLSEESEDMLHVAERPSEESEGEIAISVVEGEMAITVSAAKEEVIGAMGDVGNSVV